MRVVKKKVLIIDDDTDDLVAIKELLEANQFECLTAVSPVVGLAKALLWKPNLILLDLMLPMMSGYGFLRELKKDPKTADLPVVIISTLRDEEIASVSMDIGASGYVAKDRIDKDLIPLVYEYAA